MSGTTTQSSSAETVETVSTPAPTTTSPEPESTVAAPAPTASSDTASKTEETNKKAAQDKEVNAALAAEAAKAKTTMAPAQPANTAGVKKEDKAAPAAEESFFHQEVDKNADPWMQMIQEWMNLINDLNAQFTDFAADKIKGAAATGKALGGQAVDSIAAQVTSFFNKFNNKQPAELPPGQEVKPKPNEGLDLDADHDITMGIVTSPENANTGDELDLGETQAPKADMPLPTPSLQESASLLEEDDELFEMSELPESPEDILGSSFMNEADFQIGDPVSAEADDNSSSLMTSIDDDAVKNSEAEDVPDLPAPTA
ncbi:hypothetical protein [Legionella quinlivanii]|uniref:hypothetical protein n=1 Tax=Legionella quinlivanii TaxID=45073 RepID=UPI00224483D6|nr:hypothetical protein [Legionella quinlivanii]MCW8452152.1 hypothetical protein [Legionella quinlivanii]